MSAGDHQTTVRPFATRPKFATVRLACFVVGTILLIALAVLTMHNVPVPDWTKWTPASCMPHSCFCEIDHGLPVRQPSDSMSSLTFVLAAAIVLGLRRSGDPKTPLFDGFRILFAISLIVIGLGSAFFHASLTLVGQTADVLGMYLLVTLLVIFAIGRRRMKVRGSIIAALYVLSNVLLLALLIEVPALRRYVFAALVLALLWIETRPSPAGVAVRSFRYLVTAVGILAFGFLLWALDLTHTVCSPTSVVQGHALWHVMSALSALCIYLFYQDQPWPEAPSSLNQV
jgi:hypothetical protein